MNIWTSNFVCESNLKPSKTPVVCSDQLMCYRYELGNFYGFVEFITYYHNLYDRRSILFQSPHDTADGRKDFPADFICFCCFWCLSNYIVNCLSLSIWLNVRGPP